MRWTSSRSLSARRLSIVLIVRTRKATSSSLSCRRILSWNGRSRRGSANSFLKDFSLRKLLAEPRRERPFHDKMRLQDKLDEVAFLVRTIKTIESLLAERDLELVHRIELRHLICTS